MREKKKKGMQGKKQGLSQKITASVSALLRSSILIVCMIMLIATTILAMLYSTQKIYRSSEVYSATVDRAMQNKVAMIESIAAGVTSNGLKEDEEILSYVDSMVEMDEQVSAVYYCFPDAKSTKADGVTTIMSGGWQPPEDFVVSERGWYKGAIEVPGSVYISEPYVDVQSGGICITLCKGVYKGESFLGVVGMDMYMDNLVSLIEESYQGSNYVFLASESGTILTHPSEKYAMSVDATTSLEDDLYGTFATNHTSLKVFWDYKGGLKFGVSNVSEATGWYVITVQSMAPVLILIVGIILFTILLYMLMMAMGKKVALGKIASLFVPLESISGKVTRIADGDLTIAFDEEKNSVEIEKLTDSLTETINSLSYYIGTISNIVTAISDKNLTVEIDGDFKGSYVQIKDALEGIISSLNSSFSQIKTEAGHVFEYAKELETTTEHVANSAGQQNDSVVEVSGEMEHLNEQTKRITESADRVRENAKMTSSHLEEGTKEMERVTGAMDSIARCYDQIANFVVNIREIASQTNLLSLNASIEAARAGEAGRGFAVVAGEISQLAESSAKASENISKLIAESMNAVNRGKELVETTAVTIEKGKNDSLQSTEYIEEIVSFVEQQQKAIGKINLHMKEIAGMVESNAASAQENTAISQQLGVCANNLMNTADSFTLRQ